MGNGGHIAVVKGGGKIGLGGTPMRKIPPYPMILCLLTLGAGQALADDWPQFRGATRDATSKETNLLRSWPAGGPKVLWQVEVCEGYAGAAVHSGRVYFNDYDRESNTWLLRCLSLDDGKEIWRFTENKRIRPNHAITRTVPAVDEKYVFSLDPKCVFHCIDAKTGKEVWQKNLVREYKTRIPPWYAGQCPLIEDNRVIIAPSGSALVVALDKETGSTIWETPNTQKWPMSHASLMPTEIGGVKQYLYGTLKGPLGVSAEDGKLLWFHPFKFNVAFPTSPLAIGDGRIFLTSGYDAGSVMIRVAENGGSFSSDEVFRLEGNEWNSEVHTPVLFQDHIFAVGKKKRGLFTCLNLDGQQVWTSDSNAYFGLGGYILADGMFFVVEGKTGMLRLLEANTTGYKELASAPVLSGHDVWGPLALSDGKLLVRDLTKMICIDVGGATEEAEKR